MHDRNWWLLTAVSGALMVGTGAFAAHGLSGYLSPKLLQTFETGVRYQAWHTLAMLGVLAWRSACPLAGQRLVLGLWALGMLLFSGSLYALAVTGIGRLGIITPIGGVAMIAGWLALALCIIRTQSSLSGST
ncbi:MAG: DUF423 domain-containing protein [Halomonas sp.]|uniref:DUF423 domain-containing protein n=1 Tax=Halomonas sp. TaxID=1486246 RepID=UPI003F9223E2